MTATQAESQRNSVSNFARVAIVDYLRHQNLYAACAQQERELNDTMPVLVNEMVGNLLGTENGATKKPHSVSSAEEAVKVDPRYLERRRHLRDVVFKKDSEYAEAEACRLNARLAIALIESIDATTFEVDHA